METKASLRWRQMLIRWSDGQGVTLAVELAERYAHLLPRRITNVQLFGLSGIAQAVDDPDEVITFIQHQGERALRANRHDVKSYWDDVRQTLESLREEAVRLAAKADVSLEPPLIMEMIREFVQHLVAHSLYIGKLSSVAMYIITSALSRKKEMPLDELLSLWSSFKASLPVTLQKQLMERLSRLLRKAIEENYVDEVIDVRSLSQLVFWSELNERSAVWEYVIERASELDEETLVQIKQHVPRQYKADLIIGGEK